MDGFIGVTHLNTNVRAYGEGQEKGRVQDTLFSQRRSSRSPWMKARSIRPRMAP